MPCTGNSTSCQGGTGVLDPEAERHCLGPSTKGWFQAISFLLFVGGSFGNFSVIVVILKSFQDLSLTDLHLVGLAGFDLLGSVFLPLFYFLEISNLLHSQSAGACGFSALMYEVSITITIFMLLFTVHSFYRKIVSPRPDAKKKSRFILSTVIAFLLAAIPAYPYVSSIESENGYCHMALEGYTSFVLYTVVLFILQVILPFLLFTIMFVLLGIDLYHGRQVARNDLEADVSIIERARNQVKCKLLLIITCAYYALFVPFVFMELWFITGMGSTIIDHHECVVFDVFHLLICFKCVINPILYLFFFEGFKDNFKRVLCGWRIGRRYNFMHVKYHFRRDHQDGLVETDVPAEDSQDGNEMRDWSEPVVRDASETRLDDRDHDYDEDEIVEDKVAILRPWKNLKSTSSF